MEKRIFVYGEDCVKCHSLRPFVELSANNKGIELEEIEYKDYEDKESILTIPTLVVINGTEKKYLTDEDLVNYIRH